MTLPRAILASMVEIIPAILPTSLQDSEKHLSRVRGLTKKAQIDVVDGIYAPNRTWPYREASQREEFARIVNGKEKFPHGQEFEFQFDLMVSHPESEIQKYIALGARAIVVHAASAGAGEAVALLQPPRSGGSVAVGVALRAHDAPEAFAPFIGLCDFVQVMGIEHEGVQGEPFDPDRKAIELVAGLRKAHPSLLIQVDGGVRLENARALAEAGANRLVVGSGIMKTADPKETLEAFSKEANQ